MTGADLTVETIRGEVARTGLDRHLGLSDWTVGGRAAAVRLEPGGVAQPTNDLEVGGDIDEGALLGLTRVWESGAFRTMGPAMTQGYLRAAGMVRKNSSALAVWRHDRDNRLNWDGWVEDVLRIGHAEAARHLRISTATVANYRREDMPSRPRTQVPRYRHIAMAYLEAFGPLPYGELWGETVRDAEGREVSGLISAPQLSERERRRFLVGDWMKRHTLGRDQAAAVLGIDPVTLWRVLEVEKRTLRRPELDRQKIKRALALVARYYDLYGRLETATGRGGRR